MAITSPDSARHVFSKLSCTSSTRISTRKQSGLTTKHHKIVEAPVDSIGEEIDSRYRPDNSLFNDCQSTIR